MQTQYKPAPYARFNAFHGPKRQLLGNQAGHAAPAWRTNAPVAPGQTAAMKGKAPVESGSRIFLSRLPVDVGEKEVEELFKKTVGPLKESFLVYNSQGKSKGMAVVTFQRPGDALLARAKYNGRVVDGHSRGWTSSAAVPQAPPPTPTLIDRLAPPIQSVSNGSMTSTPTFKQKKGPKRLKKTLKRGPATVADLDREMEDYRASAPDYLGL
ncbi:hypothetical protein BDZ97DRAFT_1807169 [Flammula alnicola]|nr:hypothetical protein BDZ97DRAFT_1807169 [Flammula alnicola]